MNFYEQLFCRGRTTGEGMTHFERLFAAKFGGSPPPEVREYTGAVPVTITADGTPLLDYLISGNTVQSGTPTPDNPIMPEGCGERTRNLFDGDYTVAVMSVSGNTATLNTVSSGRTAIVKCEPNTTYAVKKYSVSNRFIIAESDIKPVNGTAMSIILNDSSKSEYSFTTSNTTQYVAIYCSTSSEQAAPQLMFNTGSTAISYEPYGYKIPISSANTTTPVYLGEVESTRRIKKLVLDGTETWGKSQSTNTFYIQNTPDVSMSNRNLTMCDHFEHTGQTKRAYGTYYTPPTSVHQFNFVWNESATVEEWKSYLAAQYAAGTPVTVWYVLEEPTTGIVNEPLMRIGDYADTLSKEQAGVTIPTNNGSTTVDVETTLKPSEVYIKYMG